MVKETSPLSALPAAVFDGAGDDVAEWFASYVPIGWEMATWLDCRAEVAALIAAARPPSKSDARFTAAALCRFLIWARTALGPVAPREAMTEHNVNRWFVNATDESDERRARMRSRLQRVVRALIGEPARTSRGLRRTPDGPYGAEELLALADAAAGSGELATALALGLTLGCTPPRTYGRIAVGPAAVEAACAAFAIPREWVPTWDAELSLPKPEWEQARSAARQAGVNLTAARLRITWLAHLLTVAEPLVEITDAARITIADFEGVAPHLRGVDAVTYRRMLRGQ